MKCPLKLLFTEKRQFMISTMSKSKDAHASPWTFTRIWCNGVWRFLKNVDEVKSTFFIVFYKPNNYYF